MNAFYEHHKDSIRFGYRCFDRILLNGLIQPFQQPERVVGFFNTYRHLYPVSRDILRGAAEHFQLWVNERAGSCRSRIAGLCNTTSMSTTNAGVGCSCECAPTFRSPLGFVSTSITGWRTACAKRASISSNAQMRLFAATHPTVSSSWLTP